MKNIVKHIINFFKYIVLGGSICIMAVCYGMAMLMIVTTLLVLPYVLIQEALPVACLGALFIIGGTCWYSITDSLRKALWR